MVELWQNDQYDRSTLPWSDTSEFFVIISQYDADVCWRHHLDFENVVYTKEQPENEPFNASNKAKSESNILKFIYQFYEYLPQNLIIVHQYNEKPYHHHGTLVDILNDPEFKDKFEEHGDSKYWCFNWPRQETMERHLDQMIASGFWKDCMEPDFGPIEAYGDHILGQVGCAQYVVSRERIRSVPRDFFKRTYDWVVKYTIDEPIPGVDRWKCRAPIRTDGHCRSNWATSRYLEWNWETIFTVRPSIDSKFPFPFVRKPLPSELDPSRRRTRVDVTLSMNSFKAYYNNLDVTVPFRNWLTMGPNPMNPAYFGHEANMNLIFTDPDPGKLKNLKITLGNGGTLDISEWRRINFWFHLKP